jgi:hypothetical protein
MMRALTDNERVVAAGHVTIWLLDNAVAVEAEYPAGTNWVPVAIDQEARRIGVLVQAPGTASRFAEIPILAVASLPAP